MASYLESKNKDTGQVGLLLKVEADPSTGDITTQGSFEAETSVITPTIDSALLDTEIAVKLQNVQRFSIVDAAGPALASIDPAVNGQANIGSTSFQYAHVFSQSGDFSTQVKVGSGAGNILTLTNVAIDQGQQGLLAIGTTAQKPAGTSGGDISVTGQTGGPAADPLAAGTGGDVNVKGGTGGETDAILPGEDGGDVNIEGGVAGAGGGASGDINIGLNDTTVINVGADILPSGTIDIGASGNRFDYGYFNVVVAGSSTYLKTDRITMNSNSGDPGSLAIGDFWYDNSTYKLKFRSGSGGGTTVELASGGISDPSGKQTNDLLQYTGSAWDAKGGVSGDRIGKVWGTDLDLNATLVMAGGSGAHFTWTTDGAGNIGASGGTRPDYVYAKTGMTIGGYAVLHANTAHVGDVTGVNGTTVVEKVRGYSMTSGAPVKGDLWQFDGTNWIHDRSRYRVLAYGDTAFTSGSGEVSICSYTTVANEFTNNSMIIMYFVVKNGSNPQIACRSYYGGTKLTDVGGWNYSHNKVDIWDWVSRENTNWCQYYYDHYGGVGTTDLNMGGAWMTAAATWSARIQNTNAGGGTTYVRAWIIEIHQGA